MKYHVLIFWESGTLVNGRENIGIYRRLPLLPVSYLKELPTLNKVPLTMLTKMVRSELRMQCLTYLPLSLVSANKVRLDRGIQTTAPHQGFPHIVRPS